MRQSYLYDGNICAGKMASLFYRLSIYQGCMSGLILGLRPANERRRYKVTPSLIGWAHKPRISPGIWYDSAHSTTITMIKLQICTHEQHPIAHPYGWAMGCLSWVIWRYIESTLYWEGPHGLDSISHKISYHPGFQPARGPGIFVKLKSLWDPILWGRGTLSNACDISVSSNDIKCKHIKLVLSKKIQCTKG